jgi:hypothetical protein
LVGHVGLTRLLHPESHGHSTEISRIDIRAHIDDRASIAQTTNLCCRTGERRRYRHATEDFVRKRVMM